MLSVTTTPLGEFLSQPNIEASPAWEFILGRAIQKPMPTLFHSRLQRNLVNYINDRTENFEAVQELRCVVPPYSPVPDIAVVARDRLPAEDGPLSNSKFKIKNSKLGKSHQNKDIGGSAYAISMHGSLEGAPDLLIEIRSPDQSTLKLQNKIIHCLGNGTQLAWLIDMKSQQVWVWQEDDLPRICSGEDPLPILGTIPQLTVNMVMAMCRRLG